MMVFMVIIPTAWFIYQLIHCTYIPPVTLVGYELIPQSISLWIASPVALSLCHYLKSGILGPDRKWLDKEVKGQRPDTMWPLSDFIPGLDTIPTSYYNYTVSDVYLVGHSLGAHAAGEAGKRTPGISRITGLDPVEPYFQNTPPEVRLDPTDALFVDVIHTDGSSQFPSIAFGMFQACGHVDFYPNGGENMPGCSKNILSTILDIDGIWQGESRTRSHSFRIWYRPFRTEIRHFFTLKVMSLWNSLPQKAVEVKMLDEFKKEFDIVLRAKGIKGVKLTTHVRGDVNLQIYCVYSRRSALRVQLTAVQQWDTRLDHIAQHLAYYIRPSTFKQETPAPMEALTLFMGFCMLLCMDPKGTLDSIKSQSETYWALIDAELNVGDVTKVKFLWNNNVINIFQPKLGAESISLVRAKDHA
eukprot:g47560.t1